MNTLVSWIDVDAVSGMARDMAAPDPAETGNTSAATVAWAGTGPAPVTRLVAEDFRLPENFDAAPFPAPGPAVPPEERSRVRNFLEEIRQKAEHSGLIPKPADDTAAADAGSTRIAVPGAANLDLTALAGTTLPPLTSLPAPGALPPLPAPATGPAGPPVVAPVPAAFKPLRSMPFSVPPGGFAGAGGVAAGGAGANVDPASHPAAGGSPPAPAGGGAPAFLHLPPLGTAAPSTVASGVISQPAFNPPNPAAETTTGTAGTPAADSPAGLPPMRRHVPHFEVPLGPLATRVRALTDWIRRQIDTSDIFILDTQGCPVGDREAVPEIVASAVVLAEAARHAAGFLPEAPVGAIYLDLEDERRLCVITTSTTHGHFTLGLILPDTLVPRAADRLRRALRRTVEADAPAPLRLPPRERW